MRLTYNETGTFYEVSSGNYANTKTVVESSEVPCIFIQNTGMVHTGNQDMLTSDATVFLDPSNTFVSGNSNRLEGMYFKITIFGHTAWYKVETVNVYRDHLLTNEIDNIRVDLNKTSPLPNVS
jgi:hypothetical protein